jgi:hypothetical protein
VLRRPIEFAGAAQRLSDEPSWPGNSAAQVEHGNTGRDAGLNRQGLDIFGAHEALLLDELARGVRRHAGSLERPDERSALILLHGRSTPKPVTISAPRRMSARDGKAWHREASCWT